MKTFSQLPGSKKGVFVPAFSLTVIYLSTGNSFFLELALVYSVSSAAFHALISELEGITASISGEELERGQPESEAYTRLIFKEDSSSYRLSVFLVLLLCLPMIVLHPYSTWLLFQNLGNVSNYLTGAIPGFLIIQVIWTAELVMYLLISQKASRGTKEIASEVYDKKIS